MHATKGMILFLTVREILQKSFNPTQPFIFGQTASPFKGLKMNDHFCTPEIFLSVFERPRTRLMEERK